ncbi:hypothetical protein, partial [Klebsiella pneumoniae]|uniref:hypothetical protein n=1 Tax=Klebsiella pneumoniae TaxID=573 RepID=UPI003EDE83C4
CVEQDDKGWDARKRAYCLKIQPATGSFARNLIYSTKPITVYRHPAIVPSGCRRQQRSARVINLGATAL